jgi:L-glyceraldehyde 3-phosphate reductase
MLTSKYIDGISSDSRAGKNMTYLEKDEVEKMIPQIRALNEIAKNRGQELSQMAIAWLLRDPVVTSVLIGASSVRQLDQNLESLKNTSFTSDELTAIDTILKGV